MTTALATTVDYQPIAEQKDKVDLVKSSLFSWKPSNQELGLFINICDRTRLDPFARQIYPMQNKGKMTTMASIDGLRVIAERSESYVGQKSVEWHDGEKWVDVWLSKDRPQAAKVTVLKMLNGQIAEIPAVAHWSEYGSDRFIWKKMPALMLAKCAESLALRKAFPNDMSGLYSQEEFDQAAPEAKPAIVSQDKGVKALESALATPAPEEATPPPEAPSTGPEEGGDAPSPPSKGQFLESLRSQKLILKDRDNNEIIDEWSDNNIKTAVELFTQREFSHTKKFDQLTDSEKIALHEAATDGRLAEIISDIPF